MATYPTAVKSFTSRADNVDWVDASDINVAYDEIVAVEATLGVTPAKSVSNLATPWNGATNYNWATVKARLDNIELGVAGDAHASLYVHQGGGDTVQTSSTSVVPLTVRGALNSSVNTFQIQDPGGTNRVTVDESNYQLYQSGQVVPYITKCGVATLTVPAGTSTGTASITFGDFTVAPVIFATVNATTSDLPPASTTVSDVTGAGATLVVNLSSTVSVDTPLRIFWLAIQGMRTGATAAIP